MGEATPRISSLFPSIAAPFTASPGTPPAHTAPVPLRTRVAGRAATLDELTSAGFSLLPSLPLPPTALLHLHRRRLTAAASDLLRAAVGASHEVAEDFLCQATLRWGPSPDRFWHHHPDYAWGEEAHPLPLVILPSHFLRLKARVAHELQANPLTQAIFVVVTVPRANLDRATDWDSLCARVDPSILMDWGETARVASAVGIAVPPALSIFPASARTVPHPRWEETVLPATQALLALRVERLPADPTATLLPPSYSRSGEHPTLAATQATARAGVSRLVLEVDLLQRPLRSGTALAFGRGALTALLRAAGSALPATALPPLQGLTTQDSRFSASLSLPTALAASLLAASGAARGVFARPWLPGRSAEPSAGTTPCPPGFGPEESRPVWARVARFSDVVAEALRASSVPHLGLVCPRQKGELGIRMPAEADPAPLARCLAALDGHLRARPDSSLSFTLRAEGLPLALVDHLSDVLVKLDPALRLLSQRVVSTTRYTLVADLVVSGPRPS